MKHYTGKISFQEFCICAKDEVYKLHWCCLTISKKNGPFISLAFAVTAFIFIFVFFISGIQKQACVVLEKKHPIESTLTEEILRIPLVSKTLIEDEISKLPFRDEINEIHIARIPNRSK